MGSSFSILPKKVMDESELITFCAGSLHSIAGEVMEIRDDLNPELMILLPAIDLIIARIDQESAETDDLGGKLKDIVRHYVTVDSKVMSAADTLPEGDPLPLRDLSPIMNF